MIRDPLGHLDDEHRRMKIKEFVETSEKVYQESLTKLRSLLSQYDPLFVLSQLSFYGLFAPVDKNSGVIVVDSDRLINQFHVEVLQALVLQIDPCELSTKSCGYSISLQIFDHVMMLCSTQNFRQLDLTKTDLPNTEKMVALVQQLMRSTTQAVRNWGHHSQVKRVSRELYCPFDEQLLTVHKFSVSNVFDVFETLIDEIESRLSSHARTFADIFPKRTKNKYRLITRYHEQLGIDVRETKRWIDYVKENHIPVERVRNMIVSHYDVRLLQVYTVAVSELSNLSNIDEDTVSAILDEYAFNLGALRECEPDRFHLSNPVWGKPLIRVGENKYFCPSAVAFFSFVIPCIESALSPFKDNVSKRRAKYLESKVAEIVKRRFPDSGIKRNVKWKEAGITYETDMLVFIDSFVLIIECKSGRIKPPALRGGLKSLRRHIKDLLIKPNLQSMRLKNRIESLISKPNPNDPLGREINLDLSKVHNVLRVSVCLEDFGAIQSSVNQLKETGWLPEDFIPCPTMNLADFETVFDILEHPVQILHYLMGRELIESTLNYLGHELDLLGLYLTTLLDASKFDPNVAHCFVGQSAPLNSYYDSQDAGVTLDKPQPLISPLFDAIFTELEQRGFDRWTEMGVALSMFSPDDQQTISKSLPKLARNLRKKGKSMRYKNTLVCVPSEASSYALGYVMFKNENTDDLRSFMENVGKSALISDHIQTVIVIAKNIDRDDAAYHCIALVERRKETAL